MSARITGLDFFGFFFVQLAGEQCSFRLGTIALSYEKKTEREMEGASTITLEEVGKIEI